jgi:hypothetical protein
LFLRWVQKPTIYIAGIPSRQKQAWQDVSQEMNLSWLLRGCVAPHKNGDEDDGSVAVRSAQLGYSICRAQTTSLALTHQVDFAFFDLSALKTLTPHHSSFLLPC